MYLVDIKTDQTRYPRVCLYGRVSDAEVVRETINKFIQQSFGVKRLIIDLGGAESLCSDCFGVLAELKETHKLTFIGYSLFLEDELKKYKLIK